MNTTVDTKLVEAAQRILPVIRDHNEEAEHERCLSKPVLDALHHAGLLRMFIPKSLGGLEVDPLTCMRVVEEVSRADSVVGWTLFNPNGWAFFCARLSDAGAEEIFTTHANPVIVGPFHPPMQAVQVEKGYRISGRSPFASNCRDASWIGTTIMVMDGDIPRMSETGEPEVRLAFFPSEDCEIIETWHVMGMRGTGSDDIAVHDVVVPASRTCSMSPEFTPGTHYQSPLYRLPAMAATAATFAPIVLAIARNAIDEVVALAQGKTPFASTKVLKERGTAQVKLAQAEGALRSARALLQNSLSEAWERACTGESASLEQKADLLLAIAQSTSSAVKVVELMYNTAGTSGIYTRHPLERYFRDIQVLKQHGFASESRYETVGQVYLGVPTEFGAVAL